MSSFFHHFPTSFPRDLPNNVLLVKIEGSVWYTIYHHLPVVKGVSSNPSIFINQPMGKDIYGSAPIFTTAFTIATLHGRRRRHRGGEVLRVELPRPGAKGAAVGPAEGDLGPFSKDKHGNGESIING